MYTLIGSPKTRAFRVLWMLEELEQPYTLLPAAPHSDDILKHNPAGKVPALLVDSEPLLDSVAICQYLADHHGRHTHAAGTIERARQDSFTQFCVDEIEGALWTAARHSFIYPEERRVPAIKEACAYEFQRALQTLEKRLGNHPYVTGEMFTVADLIIGHCSIWAQAAKFSLPKEGAVKQYLGRVLARPGFQRAAKRRETP